MSSLKKTTKQQSKPTKRISNINAKQDLLMTSLSNYFKNHKTNLRKMIKIIEGKSDVSLRIIDYFVTNYSKTHNTNLKTKKKTKEGSNSVIIFNIHNNYKTQLKSFSKKQFDPFRRNIRIDFEYETGKTIETTVAQLNFFRWAFKNKIIDYIQKNYKQIEKDMIENSKKNKKKKGEKKGEKGKKEKKVKKPKVKAKANNMNKNVTKIIVDFF